MPTKGEAFAGLSVALTTPFKDGELDVPRLREQIEFQIAAGTTAFARSAPPANRPRCRTKSTNG